MQNAVFTEYCVDKKEPQINATLLDDFFCKKKAELSAYFHKDASGLQSSQFLLWTIYPENVVKEMG